MSSHLLLPSCHGGGGGGDGGGRGSTYILKCSVDCLRDAPDVVVAVFLRILWKEQLANFLIASLYFHKSSRRERL